VEWPSGKPLLFHAIGALKLDTYEELIIEMYVRRDNTKDKL
jgi:hypothetical protein